MWAAALFFTSFILLIAFAGLRVWEAKRGVRVLEGARSALDARLPGIYEVAVTGSLPTAWRHTLAVFTHDLAHRAVVLLVEGLRAVERPLTRISFRMRITKPGAPGGKGISPFLMSIAPDKKPPSDGTTPADGV